MDETEHQSRCTAEDKHATSIVLDPQHEVLYLGCAALAVLEANAGVLRLHRQRLEAPQAGARLALTLAEAAQGRPAALALLRSGRLPLTLRAECRPGTPSSGLRLTVQDPELITADPALLRAMFDLTGTEARVAAALATGRSTAEIAAHMGVQHNTVQAHVKRLLTKTGTARQTQLVALILRSTATTSRVLVDSHPINPQATSLATPDQGGQAPSASPSCLAG